MLAPTWLRAHWRPVAIAAGLLVSFAAGWAAHRPAVRVDYREQVKWKTRVVEHVVTKTVTVAAKKEQRHQVVHRVEVTHRDGTRVVTVDSVSDAHLEAQLTQALQLHLARAATSAGTRAVQLHQEPVPPASWRIEALVGLRVAWPLQPVYGGAVSHRLLGPLWVGAWGLSEPAAGVSLGVEW